MILVSSQSFLGEKTPTKKIQVVFRKNSTCQPKKHSLNRGVNPPTPWIRAAEEPEKWKCTSCRRGDFHGLTATCNNQPGWKTHTIPYLDLPLFGVPNDDSVSGVSIHDPLGSEWHPNWKVLVSIIVLNRISYKNGTRTCPNCKSVAYMVWANQLCGTVPLCFFFQRSGEW